MHSWMVVAVIVASIGFGENRLLEAPEEKSRNFALPYESHEGDVIEDRWRRHGQEDYGYVSKNAHDVDPSIPVVTGALLKQKDVEERPVETLQRESREVGHKKPKKSKKGVLDRYRKSANAKDKSSRSGQSAAHAMAKANRIAHRYRKSIKSKGKKRTSGPQSAHKMATNNRLVHRF